MDPLPSCATLEVSVMRAARKSGQGSFTVQADPCRLVGSMYKHSGGAQVTVTVPEHEAVLVLYVQPAVS